MKFAKYEAHGEVAYGVVDGDRVMQMTGSPFEEFEVTDHAHPLSEVRLLAPCTPGKIVAIGLNYKSHLGEVEPTKVPEPFLKASTAVISTGEPIILPRESTKVQEEGELVVVIGRRCKGATADNALTYVLGYTCGNDVSDRPWQTGDLQWWRAKSADTFAPLGPFIATGLDPGDLLLTARVNGKVVQQSSTSQLIHGVPRIIEFISSVMTLEPWDAIFTGTPGEPADLHDGDTVEVEIQGVGVLSNPVRAE